MTGKRGTPEQRFWRYVAKGEGCWEWTGGLDRRGYGRFNEGPRTGAAHRYSMVLAGHRIEGWNVCHTCDNPRCVRPDHLFLGTQADNVADMITKGRQRGNETRARGSRIASSKIAEPIALAILDRLECAPRSRTGSGRFKRGAILTIAREFRVSRHIVSHISKGAWRHVRMEF